MKKCSACLICFLTQTAVVFAEVLFIRRAQGQSTDFSCPQEGPASSLTGFQLYRLYPGSPGQQGQATLLSVGEAGSSSILDPRHRGRLVVASGGLGASWVNLTLTDLQPGDTGLYALELTSSGMVNSSDRSLLTCPQVLLLVEGTDRQTCHQCHKYVSLLYSIFTTTVLLLLMATWLARERWTRMGHCDKPQPANVIYEEVNSKSEQRGPGSLQSPSHLEDPVYANQASVRQAEDKYSGGIVSRCF